MYPVILRLGPLTIYSYGAMMAVAFLTATYLTGRELERRGFSAELASRLVLWAAAGGLMGARAWSVANDLQAFWERPFHTLFSGAGFVWYGGLAGGFVAVSGAIYRYGLPWRQTVDCIAPALSLAHGIGRIGCELAGDGDWGKPSTLPWAHSYPRAIIGWENWTAAAGYPPDVRVHPTPLYEALAYTVVFAILWGLRKRALSPGSLFWLYLVLAPAARFAIEYLRLNPAVLWGLTQAQLFSALLIAVGIGQLAATRAKRAARPTARQQARQ